MNRRAFTLLEIVIALAILSISLMVLIDGEAQAVVMTVDSQKTIIGNALAQEKMSEVQFTLEMEGWTDANISEEGDFSDYGSDGSWGEDIDFEGEFDDYKWAYTVRKVELSLGDTSGAMESMQSAGMGLPEDPTGNSSGADEKDLSDLGVQPDAISDMLAPFLREVRVLVWWGEDPKDGSDCEDCIELVTHLINPNGQVNTPAGIP